MLAALVARMGLTDPLLGLEIGDHPDPEVRPGWEVVEVRAASINHHDLWTLRGVVGVPFQPPVVLGCDAAGVTADGREVVVYPVLGDGAEFRMLSDGVDGTLARYVAAPSANLVPKPESLSWEEAACLPTAWLTAWRMLVSRGQIRPGERLLVQGAGGGVGTAAIVLGLALGAEVVATSRRDEALEAARRLGVHEAILSGSRLAKPADVVVDTIGTATWQHSLRSLGQGGRLVTAGATTGSKADIDIQRLFWREASVHGVRMGSLEEFMALCRYVDQHGLRPPICAVHDGVERVPHALRQLESGDVFGKVVVRLT